MSNTKKEMRLAKLPYHVMLGLSATAVTAAPAIAQTTNDQATDENEDESILEEVIVTGMRASLLSSQNIRMTSDVIVDAVTSEDIGALPDRSVTEVLQRIPGVAITRFAGANDPDHFANEGSGAVVRGLNFVRSELNGRDVFTADSGQALGFNTVSPELMGSVQVFKSQSADMIEGGIGGTVNLITRKPLDQEGSVFAWSAEANYGDLREEWTPGLSALYSNNWQLASGGTFGFLVSAAYNELKTRSDGSLVADWLDRDGSGNYVPTGAGIRSTEFDRERTGLSGALQWESSDGRHEATLEFFRSTFDNSWGEHVIEPGPDAVPTITPAPGTEFTFDNNGLFESGIISESVGWRFDGLPLDGTRNIIQRRTNDNESTTSDLSLNYKWAINDQWRTNFDLQYSESEVDIYDISVQSAIYMDTFLDMRGSVPTIEYLPPAGYDDGYLQDPANHFWRSIMDHETDNEGEEIAFRADAEYDFEGSNWARSIRFGGRVTEREQTVLRSTYNWGAVSREWDNPMFLDDPRLAAGDFMPYTFDNFQGRGNGPANVPIYAGDMSQDYLQQWPLLHPSYDTNTWGPLYNRPLTRADVVPGTSFLPSEWNETKMDTASLYFRFDFDFEFDNGMFLDGNIGVRYVETDVTAEGGVQYPVYTFDPDRCVPENPGERPPGICFEDPATIAAYEAWADGSSYDISDEYDYDHTLPSLNLRWGINEFMFVRFSYSKAISRPDFGLLKSNFAINNGGDNPVTGEWLGPQADAAQVRINPIEADQFDLSWEWYFADVGSITVTGFYKDMEEYIVPGVSQREFVNNGEAFDVNVAGSTNTPDGGKIKGVEIAYQQVFSMLPGLWGGLGVQANYTYIDTDGVPNVGVDNVTDSGLPEGQTTVDVSQMGLPGLSEDTANLVAFWETERISTRLAYNYRSEYTLTTRDVIFPYTPIVHGDTGTLDFSFFYTFNEMFKIGLQAVNLTDEVTETYSVINEDLDLAPRGYFLNDRRYSLIWRGSF